MGRAVKVHVGGAGADVPNQDQTAEEAAAANVARHRTDEEFIETLEKFFTEHKPEKIKDVDKWSKKCKGKEDKWRKLFAALAKKYNVVNPLTLAEAVEEVEKPIPPGRDINYVLQQSNANATQLGHVNILLGVPLELPDEEGGGGDDDDDELPGDWEVQYDEDTGRRYYFNPSTNESSFTKPDTAKDEAFNADLLNLKRIKFNEHIQTLRNLAHWQHTRAGNDFTYFSEHDVANIIMTGTMLPAWYKLKNDQVGVDQEQIYPFVVREEELCRDDCEVYEFGHMLYQETLCAQTLCKSLQSPPSIARTLKKLKQLMIRKDVADMFDEGRYHLMIQLLVALLHQEYDNRPPEEEKEEDEDDDDEQPEEDGEDAKPKPPKSDISPFFLAFSCGLLGLTKGMVEIKINKGLDDPTGMKMLLSLIVGNHHLQELKLSRSSMNSTSFMLLAKALPWLTSITTVDVSANKVCATAAGKPDMEPFQIFTEAVAQHKSITNLNISHVKFGEEGAEMVAVMLGAYTARLENLGVKGNGLSEEKKVMIGDALFASKVIFLELFSCDEYTIAASTSQVKMIDKGLTCSDAALFAGVVSSGSMHKLTKVNWARNNIGVLGAHAMAKVVPLNHFKYVNLSCNAICGGIETVKPLVGPCNHPNDYSGLKAFMKSLDHSTITELDLSGNSMTDPGGEAIAEVLHKLKDCNIVSLHLQGNGMHDVGKVALGNAFFAVHTVSLEVFTCDEYKITRKTKALDISNHGLHHSDASMLSGVLSGCGVPQLLDLDMSCNNIGVKGAIALAKVVPKITLTSLNLASNNLCGEYFLFGEGDYSGFFALSQAVHMASANIDTLDISDNLLGPDGIAVFRDSVRSAARRLTSLSLARNDIAIPGSSVVAQLMQLHNFSDIKFLNLAHNDLGADGLRTIAPTLAGMHNLVTFDIADNSLAEATDGTLDYSGILALASVLGAVRSANASTLVFDDKNKKEKEKESKEAAEGDEEDEEGAATRKKGTKRRRRKHEVEEADPHADKLYLHSLSLADNSIGAPGLAGLAYALMVQEDIKSLDLSGNCLGEVHWKPFLKHQEILQTAGVKGSGITIFASLLKNRDGEYTHAPYTHHTLYTILKNRDGEGTL
jgi:Ran GTPase-activating protein (RanGAP) involved in mRNA processing and transport